jgi:hypothetical protein
MCTLNMVTHSRGPQLMPKSMNQSDDLAFRSLDALEALEAGLVAFGHGDPWRDGVPAAVSQARVASRR